MRTKIVGILLAILMAGAIVIFGSNKVPEDMVFVKGGTFQMGTDEEVSFEEPVHTVKLDSFYIGTYEVTQKEWREVMNANPSVYIGDNIPVQKIGWTMAVEYCNKLSQKEGLTPCYSGSGDGIVCNFEADGYRLPTEAEWEYACRGGLKSGNYLYSGSNNPDEVAWHELNSGDKIQPVGKKRPNELGLHDMSGNIWEWCWDRYDPGYYKNSPVDNPKGPDSGSTRNYRGGGGPGGKITWLRCTNRNFQPASFDMYPMGLRIVKNTAGKKTQQNMVLVEGGTFQMGSSTGDLFGRKPAHTAAVSSFYMGKYEVTQAEWRAVMGNNPALWIGLRSPVESITWYDAVKYCNKRSRMEGLTPCYSGSGQDIVCDFEADGYRLPSETEWEYAAKGGVLSRNYKYSGSNNPDEVAWYQKNTGFSAEAVGLKKPNELGIYDMTGNVWEWCWDWCDEGYYKHSPRSNPRGPASGVRRAVRGGAVTVDAGTITNVFRLAWKPHHAYRFIGFRVVRTAR